MSQPHKTVPIFQRDAWLSIIACFLLQILSGLVFLSAVHMAFPSLSKLTLYYSFPILSLMLPIIYLSFRYGYVRVSDIVLRGSDFIVLFLALIVLFVIISFISFQGPYRPYTYGGLRISQLPSFEYYVVLFEIFLMGPFLEETLFRKYIFEIFRKKYNILLAILLTSFCETLVHLGAWNLSGLVLTLFLFIFFILIYIKSKLGVSIIIHCLTNFSIYFISWM
jgi:membrane protease YdiL (CAAX protease family)